MTPRMQAPSGTAPRGNVATVAQFLNTNNSWLTTTMMYDTAGNLVWSTDANGNGASWSYNDNYSDGVNHNACSQVTSITNALNQTSTVQYDYSTGKPTLSTDINNIQTAYAYDDPLDRLTIVKSAYGVTNKEAWTEYSYFSPVWLKTTADQTTKGDQLLVTEQNWDGFGRPKLSILFDNASNTSQYVETDMGYDALGRVAWTDTPWRSSGSSQPGYGPQNTYYSYDPLGRPTQVQTPDGAVATTSYTANAAKTTDQAGHAKTLTTDAWGRLTQVVEDPGGANFSTSYVYGANNALQTVNQGSQQRVFYSDSLGRIYATTQPEIAGTVYYGYDSVGNLTSMSDPRSASKTIAYDALNRPKTITYSYLAPTTATYNVTYTYDNSASGVNTNNTKGRLLSVANTNSTTSFTSYDPLGRVTASSQTTGSYPSRSFSYAYDLAGSLASETYPDGRVVTSGYDGAERPYSLSGVSGSTNTNYITQATYWPDGVPWYFVRGANNNVWHVNAINVRMQVPETYEAIGNNNTPSQMLFVSCPNWGVNPSNYGTYDICSKYNQTNDNGNLQNYEEYHGGPGYSSLLYFKQTFTYDNLNRLQTASDTGGWSRNFGYDRYGNMTPSAGTGNTIPLQGNSPTSFDATTNRMSLPDSSGTTYDSVGNQTHVNGNDVGYDVENRATSLAGGVWTYSFDGLSQRVQKAATSGVSTQFVYDAFGQLAAEYSGGTWARDYIHWGSGGGLIATENSSGPCATCYFGFDHLGSVRLVMDQNANVIGRHDYLPYGEEVAANAAGRNSSFGPANDNVTTKFTGQLRDTESGIDYFNARNFVGPLGRFTSADPGSAGADLADPQTWNGYAYVRNSPMHVVDPSGMADSNPGDPGDPDPCGDFGCDPFPPPYWGGGPVSTPPAPPSVTSTSGGSPIPAGSFLGGESAGLPAGIGVPSVLQVLLGAGADNRCDFGACNGFADAADSISSIQSWYNQILEHLAKIEANPSSVNHYNVEIRAFVNNILKRATKVTAKRSPGALDKYLQRAIGVTAADLRNLLPDVLITIDPCAMPNARFTALCAKPPDHI